MNNQIIIKDYLDIKNRETKIPNYDNETAVNYCKQIQKKIENYNNIMTIFDEKINSKPPIVFKDFNNSYWSQQYVGVIRAKVEDKNNNIKDVTIQIGSRFDRENSHQYFLNYVFSKAFDTTGKLFKDMNPHSSPEDTWDMLLMIIFINQLETAIKQGTFRQYRTFEYNDSKIKGRIDFNRHIKLNPIMNGKIAYSTREYTSNNPVNALVLLAYDCLEKKYNESFREVIKSRNNLKKHILSLKSSIPNYQGVSYKDVLKEIIKPIKHPYYNKYENLRKTSILILRRLGLNIFSENNDKVYGVLIDMNKLWEKFIDKAIFQQDENLKSVVQNSSTVLVKLIEGELQGRREFKPDFYKKEKAVFDAKYRQAWQENVNSENSWNNGVRNDVFQVMGYMLALNVNIGGVIFPIQINQIKGDREHIETFDISEQCKRKFLTIAYDIPIVNNYEEFERRMNEQNEKIIAKIKKYFLKTYIFLDFDGVLVTKFSELRSTKSHAQFDRLCVETLNDTIKRIKEVFKCSVEIVVISNWRYDLEESEISKMLTEVLDDAEVIIDFPQKSGSKQKDIEAYINSYGHDDVFLILDDESLSGNLQNFQIKPRSEDGLRDRESIIAAALDILNSQLHK